MPYQCLPDTWGAEVVAIVVTLDQIIPSPSKSPGFYMLLHRVVEAPTEAPQLGWELPQRKDR